MIDLEEHKRLEAEATPGPWCEHPNGTSIWTGSEYDSEGIVPQEKLYNNKQLGPDTRIKRAITDNALVVLMRNGHAEMILEIEASKSREQKLEKRLSAVCAAIGISAELPLFASADEFYDRACDAMRRLCKGAAVAENLELHSKLREQTARKFEERARFWLAKAEAESNFPDGDGRWIERQVNKAKRLHSIAGKIRKGER